MTQEEAHRAAQHWIEAWNNHDLESILTHYAEDIEFCSPFISRLVGSPDGTIRSKTALRDYCEQALTTFPDLRFELFQVFAGIDSYAVYYRSVDGILANEVMTLNRDGLVTHVKAHYREVA